MRRFVVAIPLLAAVLAIGTGAARATETVPCSGVGGDDAAVEMNIGSGLPAALPNWVRVSVGDRVWSTLGDDVSAGAIPVHTFQAFDDGRLVSIDLSDDAVSEIVISLRILVATEGERTVAAGTLQIPGDSVHPIVCDFGEPE